MRLSYLQSEGEELQFVVSRLIPEEGESSGFIYMSRNEDSANLMASSADVEEDLQSMESMSPPPPTYGIKNPMPTLSSHRMLSSIAPISTYQNTSTAPISTYENTNHNDSDDGYENVEYCEQDEAHLKPAMLRNTYEHCQSLPFLDIGKSTDTLFNLTATSPQKLSPNISPQKSSLVEGSPLNREDTDFCDVNLSPFKSTSGTAKERAHRLITSIFELENDQIR